MTAQFIIKIEGVDKEVLKLSGLDSWFEAEMDEPADHTKVAMFVQSCLVDYWKPGITVTIQRLNETAHYTKTVHYGFLYLKHKEVVVKREIEHIYRSVLNMTVPAVLLVYRGQQFIGWDWDNEGGE